MGAELTEHPDGLEIARRPRYMARTSIPAPPPHRHGICNCGVAAEGDTEIDGAEAAAISFPEFFDSLNSLASVSLCQSPAHPTPAARSSSPRSNSSAARSGVRWRWRGGYSSAAFPATSLPTPTTAISHATQPTDRDRRIERSQERATALPRWAVFKARTAGSPDRAATLWIPARASRHAGRYARIPRPDARHAIALR